ncbi:MAG: hypothetical protein GF398_10505 [Chitinivibrionales bacterium]|nr:hypothetical protein [Chitinivibrionales bacterium]
MKTESDIIIEKVRTFFQAHFHEIAVVTVFGSVVKNRLRKDSDVDIGIACESEMTLERRIAVATELSGFLHRDVDIIDLSKENGFIITEAVSSGKIIIKRNTETLRKIIRKMWYWNSDFAPLMRRSLDRKAQRFIYGT